MYMQILVLFLALSIASVSVAENTVSNGGFEFVGTEGESTAADWVGFGNSAGVFVRDSTMPMDDGWAFKLETGSTSAQARVVQDGRLLGLPSLTPGTTVSLSFDVKFDNGDIGFLGYNFRLRNNNGSVEGEVNPIVDTGGSYITIIGPTFQVPDEADVFFTDIEFFLDMSSSSASEPAIAFIDNVRIEGTFVPEPSSGILVLFAFGILAVLRRRNDSRGAGTFFRHPR